MECEENLQMIFLDEKFQLWLSIYLHTLHFTYWFTWIQGEGKLFWQVVTTKLR